MESEVAEQGPGRPGKPSGPGKPFRFHSKVNRKVRKSFKPDRGLCGEYRGVVVHNMGQEGADRGLGWSGDSV